MFDLNVHRLKYHTDAWMQYKEVIIDYELQKNKIPIAGSQVLIIQLPQFTTMYAPWQKDRSKLVIKHILGEGNFGSVCLGIMPDVFFQGVSSQVAVKTIKVNEYILQHTWK